MTKKSSYTEFVSNKSTISFVGKGRHFVNKHFGVALTKAGIFFKNIGRKFEEKFVEYDEVETVRKPIVSDDSIAYSYVNENDMLYNECVELAHDIDKAIKNNKNVDLTAKSDKLKSLVFDLKDSKSDYSKLNEIHKSLNDLKSDLFSILMESHTPKLITSDHTVNHGPFTMTPEKTVEVVNEDKKEEKTNKEEVKVVIPEVKPVEVKKETKPVEIKAIVVKTPERKTNEYSRIKSKISLFDRKIAALESKVALSKKPVKEIVGLIAKTDKILNEENLDSREIRMYKELRDERIAELNNALAKRDEATKELEKVKVEKALYEQSNIEIDVPQKNGEVFRKEIRVKDYLEQKERDAKFEKTKKEQVKREKLEKEIALLKAKLAEKEAMYESIADTLDSSAKKEYTDEEYHDTIVRMHRPSFY